jgi:drug/metabolite transporter (DMT)-like permease
LFGVAVLIGIDALHGFGINILAEFAVLAASCSYSLGLIYGRKFAHLPSPVAGMGQLCGSTLTITLLVLMFEPPWQQTMPSWHAISAVLGLAILGTAMAYTVFFRILATAGATATSLVSFLTPVAALLLSFIFLGEEVAPNHLAGMALIFAGLAVIDGRILAMLRR